MTNRFVVAREVLIPFISSRSSKSSISLFVVVNNTTCRIVRTDTVCVCVRDYFSIPTKVVQKSELWFVCKLV